ncbi:MAG: polysaccharide deacetylase family protein [Alphaproteobacteria bacterium]|nr:polysaccharide deacetylase family protein [Alphaproteobacteria bacterium]
MHAHGLMFHHFCDEGVHPRGQGAITADQFRDLLEFVGTGNILSPSEWMERVETGSLESHHLCLTFDDALRCQYDVALPVMEDLGLQGFWFVYSSVFQGGIERLEVYRYFRTVKFDGIEDFYQSFEDSLGCSSYAGLVQDHLRAFTAAEYLAQYPIYTDADRRFRFLRDEVLGPKAYLEIMDQLVADSGLDVGALPSRLWLDDMCLRTLQDKGHVVGLHSFSHPTRLANLPATAQRDEYAKNFKHLSEVLGRQPRTVAHPCNSYNSETLSILREMGVVMGFRADMSQTQGGRLELPREDHAMIMRRAGLA